MKYFFDTEFIEGLKKPIPWLPTIGQFNRPYHSIQLISIGIVAEDGREYYAISSEFNPADANPWVKENVISKLDYTLRFINHGECSDGSALLEDTWKSNKQIAQDIKAFCSPWRTVKIKGPIDVNSSFGGALADRFIMDEHGQTGSLYYPEYEPEFYAYYADYDWVVFCSLFGTMMDLPKGFPMYCRDLKQMLDEKAEALDSFYRGDIIYAGGTMEPGDRKASIDEKIKSLKARANYPAQDNEHNALDDAKWNYQLYKFLKSI
jgi:hypothetical protein